MIEFWSDLVKHPGLHVHQRAKGETLHVPVEAAICRLRKLKFRGPYSILCKTGEHVPSSLGRLFSMPGVASVETGEEVPPGNVMVVQVSHDVVKLLPGKVGGLVHQSLQMRCNVNGKGGVVLCIPSQEG